MAIYQREDMEYGKFDEGERQKYTVRNKIVSIANEGDGIDGSTNTLQFIDYEHHEIHAGSHYTVFNYVDGLSVGDTVEFTVTTPDTTTWAHMSYELESITGGKLEIFEGTTGVSGGTTITPINNNRNSTNTSTLTILLDPTAITDDGTSLGIYLAGANRGSGQIRRDKELILKQNTTYLFRFTSTANSNSLGYIAKWYEHADKN